MKIMAASDLHGSYGWTQKTIQKFREEKADKLLLLGDLLYHGPRNDLPDDYQPKQVIGLLNSIKESIIAVRGNCDTEVDQMVLDFPIMADYAYIVSGDLVIFATHGHIYNPQTPPKLLSSGGILLYGHTHIAEDRMTEGFRYMNPGSPSIPKNGSLPSYIIIENGNAELKTF